MIGVFVYAFGRQKQFEVFEIPVVVSCDCCVSCICNMYFSLFWLEYSHLLLDYSF